MPQLLKKLLGIMLVVSLTTSCGCATLFNSVNLKNAPRESFVKIEVATDQYVSTGSGVIIRQIDNSNTVILTAGHICKDNTIAMRILDLYENQFGILSFVTSDQDDLCVIMVDGKIDAEPLPISKNAPEIGDHAYNIAAPRAIHAPNMSLMFDGYYQGRIRIIAETYPLDIYSVAGMGGSSGSPMFNDNWEIIGVISRGMDDFQHVMLSINQERTKRFYDYALSEKFIDDIKIATEKHNKKIIDYMNKVMAK